MVTMGSLVVLLGHAPALAEQPAKRDTDEATTGEATTGKATTGKATTDEEPARPGHFCAVMVGLGPRFGGSLNGDQWVVGFHGRLELLCLGGLTFDAVGVAGFGGNHATLRPSIRATYHLRLLDKPSWAPAGLRGEEPHIYPVIGASFLHHEPVGPFAEWCHRYDVAACSATEGGLELGGGIGYWLLGFEGIAGLGGLPVVTMMATVTFPLVGD